MRFGDLTRYRQSESDAARPGGEKWFKDPIAKSRRDAGSGIFDHQLDRRIFRATFDPDFTTYRRSLRGIGQKAGEHLCDQIGIGTCDRASRRVRTLDADLARLDSLPVRVFLGFA